jgi:tetratricopeptide (TPR) repeat protein
MRKAAKKGGKTQAPVPAANAWANEKAIKEFERGIGHLHRQNYAEAADHFKAVLEEYPAEKELSDRARVYTRICKGMLGPRQSHPRSSEDYFYFGVMKANEAEYDEAVKLLARALEANPKDEKVHYVLASTLALKGERDVALKHLKEAIDLNATNRVYALNDPDFEPLRDDETFQNLIHPDER